MMKGQERLEPLLWGDVSRKAKMNGEIDVWQLSVASDAATASTHGQHRSVSLCRKLFDHARIPETRQRMTVENRCPLEDVSCSTARIGPSDMRRRGHKLHPHAARH